jgi:hypothetical protein
MCTGALVGPPDVRDSVGSQLAGAHEPLCPMGDLVDDVLLWRQSSQVSSVGLGEGDARANSRPLLCLPTLELGDRLLRLVAVDRLVMLAAEEQGFSAPSTSPVKSGSKGGPLCFSDRMWAISATTVVAPRSRKTSGSLQSGCAHSMASANSVLMVGSV